MRSPGYVKCTQWLSEIWRDFDSELVKKSFVACGIQKHAFEQNEVLIYRTELHSVLIALIEKGTFNYYADDDLELEAANDLMGDDEAIFDEIEIEDRSSYARQSLFERSFTPITSSAPITSLAPIATKRRGRLKGALGIKKRREMEEQETQN